MEAVGVASWLLGKVVTKLSDELVAAYVSSSQLGLNFQAIKLQLLHTQGLLHAAQLGTDHVSNNPGLCGLLDKLSKKADEAEDMLDELHYFIIQDELDGTKEAADEMGSGLHAHALHGRHALRHIVGNCLSCFSCSPTQDGVGDSPTLAATSDKYITKLPASCSNADGATDNLTFDRVAMSNKIKLVAEEMNSICARVSDLLKTPNHNNTSSSTHLTLPKRTPMGSIVAQDKKLHGRSDIFQQTINMLTGGRYHGKTLSVIPIFGLGGIGKTTFTQHIYNDEKIQGHFPIRIWVCVSTDFNVIKLTREILHCILATEKQQNTSTTTQTTNLDQLQRATAEKLKSKRFLIVLDDIWKCNSEGDWKNLLAPFTKGEAKGSIVLVTTRFPSIVRMVKTTDPIELHGLEPDAFLALFEAYIFGDTKPGHYEDDLIDIAKDIAIKLRGTPLAAHTVGRLLKKNLSREYWMGVLEKNEWQNTKNEDDIMPSLKISYHYLPFHLKKCFSYCSLFPEDYKFDNLEITNFWIAIGIIDSNCQDGNNYLEELVDNGFLTKKEDDYGEYYVMHDLLHELSQSVSSHECFNINSSSFRADDIARSIRHLSITVKLDKNGEIFREEIGKLKDIVDIKNLRTLMIFGSYELDVSNILKDTFEEIKDLRVLLISMNTRECLPKNFSNLIHLRYLRLISNGDDHDGLEIILPSTLSRFYHLKFLDLQEWSSSEILPKNISRLVNLRYFHSSNELHSNIPEVGKMKYLQELKEFHVKKESVGFELRQLGELTELGELGIYNIETVATKEEASDAKLKNKRNLKLLELVWGREHQTRVDDGDVLEGLKPPSNLKVLEIKNYGGAVGPSWLLSDISMERLESLHLEGVCWSTLPPFEWLPHLAKLVLKKISGMRVFGPGSSGVTEKSLMHLKTIVIKSMPDLEEWVGGPNSPLFPRLEEIECYSCPILFTFSFLECCTNLQTLYITKCPKVVSQLPPLPHTRALTDMYVGDGDSSFLSYSGMEMEVSGRYDGALAFQNMDRAEVVEITDYSPLQVSLSEVQKLNSLRILIVDGWDNIFSAEVKSMNDDDDASCCSFQFEELDVDSISGVLIAPFCSRLAARLQTLVFSYEEKTETLTEEQEEALYLLTSLQCLEFYHCKGLRSLPRGLYRLPSLKELSMEGCDGIQSLPHMEDLPLASLQTLDVSGCSEEIQDQAITLKQINPSLFIELEKEDSVYSSTDTEYESDE